MFHSRSNDIGEDGNHFPTKCDIPLRYDIFCEDGDGPRNKDYVLSHSSATIQGSQDSLIGSPNGLDYYTENDIPLSDEDIPESEDDEANGHAGSVSVAAAIKPPVDSIEASS